MIVARLRSPNDIIAPFSYHQPHASTVSSMPRNTMPWLKQLSAQSVALVEDVSGFSDDLCRSASSKGFYGISALIGSTKSLEASLTSSSCADGNCTLSILLALSGSP